MIRILTAAAMAALLSVPALAQTSPYGSSTTEQQPSQLQDQAPSAPGGSGSLESAPGAQSGQVPVDCLPNDPRPECQIAEMPSDQSPGSGSMSQPGGTILDERLPDTSATPGTPGAPSAPSAPETTR